VIAQIKNFLPNRLAEDIRETFLSPHFSWYFNENIIDANQNCPTSFQFIHSLYKQEIGWTSDIGTLIQTMLYIAENKLQFTNEYLIRSKANLLTLSTQGPSASNIHKDLPDQEENQGKCLSLLYYVHDSDGDTLIFDDAKENIVQRITPQFNSAILFNSNTWHSSSPPMKQKRRVVINTVVKAQYANSNI
jgi:hypothetical protein